ncbi:MAG: hypothetical protein ACTTIZ_03775 [Treponema sp.]
MPTIQEGVFFLYVRGGGDMRKILLFLLIVASFSCATLDNKLKEDSNVEKKVEKPKGEVNTLVSNEKQKVDNSESLEDIKKNDVSEKETDSSANQGVQKETEKSLLNSSPNVIKNNEEDNKKEANDEASYEKNKDTSTPKSKNDEKKTANPSNRNIEGKEAKPKEIIENKIKVTDERALQEYDGLFSSQKKVEPKKEERKEEKNLLSSLEILKELEDAISIFQKTIPNIVRQRVGKKEKEVEKEEAKQVEKIETEPSVPEIAKEDETLTPSNPPVASFNDDGGSTYTFNDDGEPEFSFNDDSTFIFEEDEPQFSFNEEQPLSTFDDEQKNVVDEKHGKSSVQDNKGQLSTVVDEEDKVNISRYTNILKGQNIDFSYPGEGWVYLGEETSQKGLSYVKRKMEDGKTFFTFTAESEGNYVLNFSYFDVFSGDFIVDAVSVKVVPNNDGIQKDALVLEYQGKGGKKTFEDKVKQSPNEVNVDADKVSINAEETSKEEKSLPKESVTNKIVESSVETLKPSSNNKPASSYQEPEVFTNVASINPENAKNKATGEDARKILDEVSKDISNGNAKVALEGLDNFFAVASTNMDEAYFLRGKAYELNTELKNIKMALAAYKFLTKTFPDSLFWNEADARVRYIEKFFVKIK